MPGVRVTRLTYAQIRRAIAGTASDEDEPNLESESDVAVDDATSNESDHLSEDDDESDDADYVNDDEDVLMEKLDMHPDLPMGPYGRLNMNRSVVLRTIRIEVWRH